jgi:hypothetical protein
MFRLITGFLMLAVWLALSTNSSATNQAAHHQLASELRERMVFHETVHDKREVPDMQAGIVRRDPYF